MPSQPCYFVDKAAAASAAPALKIFCSILHQKRCLHKIWDITVTVEHIYDTDPAYLEDLMPWSENLPDICRKDS